MAAKVNLFAPPPIFSLPFSLGGDLYVGFIYKPLVVDFNNEPILDAGGKKQYQVADYPAGATVEMVIDLKAPAAPLVIPAEIDGSIALIWSDKADVEDVIPGLLWRLVITYDDGLDQVMCNGTTVRSDGR